jgi:hypothetical protein
MKPKRVTLKPGDVFEMPLADGRIGYGVIVRGGGVPYVIILRSIHDVRPELSELANDGIALVGQTMDALIYHGRWTIVFRDYPTRPDVPFPNWKVQIDGQMVVTDFSGQQVLGRASPEETDFLDFKFSRAPIAYQNALEALHGLRAWEESYEKLTPTYASARMTRSG